MDQGGKACRAGGRAWFGDRTPAMSSRYVLTFRVRVPAGRRVITAGQSLNRPSSPVLRYDEALSGLWRLKRYRHALRLIIRAVHWQNHIWVRSL